MRYLAIGLCLLLCSCGFTVKPSAQSYATLSRTYIQTNPSDPFAKQLKLALHVRHIKTVDNTAAADYEIVIGPENIAATELGDVTDNLLRARRYSLTVSYTLVDKKQHKTSNNLLTTSRFLTTNSNTMVGQENQQQQLMQQLRQVLVQQFFDNMAMTS